LFGRIGSGFGGAISSLFGRNGSSTSFSPPSRDELVGLFGNPRPANLTQDSIASEIFVAPYRGPGDLDHYGRETPQMRDRYRTQYLAEPVVKAAVQGKVSAVSILEVSVLPADRRNPIDRGIAEFVHWTVAHARGGWHGLIRSILTAGVIDGWSLSEKKLAEVHYKGRSLWGLDHVRNLDTAIMRLELDIYRNVTGIVNMVRGIEYYSPDQVLLYTHNPLYSNPFGHSDLRAATRAANIIEDVYKLWYVLLNRFGTPYFHGKAKDPSQRKMMEATLSALRAGGWAVTGADDEILVLDLAVGAGSGAFKDIVQTMREDILFAIRGAALPFLEGDGGNSAHGDTNTQKVATDVTEEMLALDAMEVINHQLIPWLVKPNWGDKVDLPTAVIGMTNVGEMLQVAQMVKAYQDTGLALSKEWVYQLAKAPPPDDPEDELKPPSPPGGGPPGLGGPLGLNGKPAEAPTTQPAALPPYPSANGTPEPAAPAAAFAADASGHEHKGPGAGGGQFTGKGASHHEEGKAHTHRLRGGLVKVLKDATGGTDSTAKVETWLNHAKNTTRGHFKAARNKAVAKFTADYGECPPEVPAAFAKAASKVNAAYSEWADFVQGVASVVARHPAAGIAPGNREQFDELHDKVDAAYKDAQDSIWDAIEEARDELGGRGTHTLGSYFMSDDFAAGYDEKDHPRDDAGRYVDKDEMEWAKSDPEIAADLRKQVTKPEERAKLEAKLAGGAKPAPKVAPAEPDAHGPPNPDVPDAARPSLDPHEIDAIKRYCEWDYDALNRELRKTGQPPKALTATAAALESAFEKAKPFGPPPVVANRALSIDREQLGAFVEGAKRAAESGGEFPMGGFISTEVNPKYKPDPTANVQLKINAIHGLDVMPYSKFGGAESELLLNHGSKFKVKSVTQVGRQWHVELDQVA
jgi:hypothetical protein